MESQVLHGKMTYLADVLGLIPPEIRVIAINIYIDSFGVQVYQSPGVLEWISSLPDFETHTHDTQVGVSTTSTATLHVLDGKKFSVTYCRTGAV